MIRALASITRTTTNISSAGRPCTAMLSIPTGRYGVAWVSPSAAGWMAVRSTWNAASIRDGWNVYAATSARIRDRDR